MHLNTKRYLGDRNYKVSKETPGAKEITINALRQRIRKQNSKLTIHKLQNKTLKSTCIIIHTQ